MPVRKTLLIICIVLLWLTGTVDLRALQTVQLKDQKLKEISTSIEVFDGVAYVGVILNNEYEASFLIDTGADSVSAISRVLARTMGVLPSAAEGWDAMASRRNKITRLYGTRLSIDGNHFVGFDFIALPLDKLYPYWGRKVDGILGGNIIKDFVLTLDYELKTMTLSRQNTHAKNPAFFRLPMTVMGTTPVVEGGVVQKGDKTRHFGRFIVDTGVRQSFINTPFTTQHKLIAEDTAKVQNITGFGFGGLIFETVGRIAFLDLGGARLKNPVIQLSEVNEGLRASTLFDGILGADILSRFTVVFDFPAKMLYLRPNKTFHEPFVYDMSGIYFTMEHKADQSLVRVVNVVDDSPASRAGVRKEDRILELDGRDIAEFSMPGLKDYFKRQGSEIRMKLERNGKVLNAAFVLQPLL